MRGAARSRMPCWYLCQATIDAENQWKRTVSAKMALLIGLIAMPCTDSNEVHSPLRTTYSYFFHPFSLASGFLSCPPRCQYQQPHGRTWGKPRHRSQERRLRQRTSLLGPAKKASCTRSKHGQNHAGNLLSKKTRPCFWSASTDGLSKLQNSSTPKGPHQVTQRSHLVVVHLLLWDLHALLIFMTLTSGEWWWLRELSTWQRKPLKSSIYIYTYILLKSFKILPIHTFNPGTGKILDHFSIGNALRTLQSPSLTLAMCIHVLIS